MEMTTITTINPVQTDTSLLRLLQLSSASLPVGGYSFSQGLEYAIDSSWINTKKRGTTQADTARHIEEQVAAWLSFVMKESLSQVDLPLLKRLVIANQNNDAAAFDYWNAYTLACRETMELRLTETAMGDALLRLLNSLDIPLPSQKQQPMSFIATFATAAVHWQIPLASILMGYVWSWLENQVAAATKLVPLGQTSSQRLLVLIGEEVNDIIQYAQTVGDQHIGSSLPGIAMASSWHETQYSRLFRS